MRTHHFHSRRTARGRGFTLMELLTAMVLIGLLLAVAVPSYSAIVERQRVAQAARDLQDIAQLLARYQTFRFALPETLGELGANLPKDPWGRDYQYLNFNSTAPGVNGKIRKDHNLHPLNT